MYLTKSAILFVEWLWHSAAGVIGQTPLSFCHKSICGKIKVLFVWFNQFSLISGEKLASTIQGEKEDIDLAVSAAREAFKKWSKLSCHARARHLYSIARHVQKHIRLIAVLESLDNGKSIRETRDADSQIVARHLYHHAGWAELMETEMKGWLKFIHLFLIYHALFISFLIEIF